MAKLKVNSSKVSDKAWGNVDKPALGRRLAEAYAAGEATRAQIKEVYAYAPPDAFGKDSGGKPAFSRSKAWGPHHEVIGNEIVLNAAGLAAAAAAAAGGRSEPSLSSSALAGARAHLRRHYRATKMDLPDGLKESLRCIERGKPIEEVKGSMDYFLGEVWRQFNQTFNVSEYSGYWIEEIFDDHLILREYELPREEYWLVPYTASEADGRITCTFASEEDWELVELAYIPSAVNAAVSAEPAQMERSDRPKRGKRFEERVDSAVTVIEEAAGKSRGRVCVKEAIVADVVNANGRRYPREVLRAAVEELQSHLHESAGQGRMVLLGEAEHPSDKAGNGVGNGRPNLLETVVRWDTVAFDEGSGAVRIDGLILETSKGKDILALMEGGVRPGGSLRGYGESRFVVVHEAGNHGEGEGEGRPTEGRRIEEVTELHVTGYDLVLEPSFDNVVEPVLESKTKQETEEQMDPEKLAELIRQHPELFEGIVADQVKTMGEAQLKALEETVRRALGIGQDADFGKALTEAAEAKRELDARKRKDAVDAAIAEAVKDLPYSEALNKLFADSLREANPDSPEAVKRLAEAKRKEYDAIAAADRLGTMGFRSAKTSSQAGVQVVGPVIERETGVPAFASGAYQFTESMSRAGYLTPWDMRKPATINQKIAAEVLKRFDAVHQEHLLAESRRLEEASTTSDLTLPYSISRTIISAMWPQLVAASVFDFGVTDQALTYIYYETFAKETGVDATVTDEDVTADLGEWVALANKRLKSGTVVVTNVAGDVTYIEGTDYVIDYGNGKLFAISGGAITDSLALHVDYGYLAIRKGEGVAIERAKNTLARQALEMAADRLATDITTEMLLFSRGQLGYDVATRTVNNMIAEIRRKKDGDIFQLAITSALRVASNTGGTWNAAGTDYADLIKKIGLARVILAKRYYQPTAIVMSTSLSDDVANWEGFTAAGKRPDADLSAEGYVGRLKGVPVFDSTEFPDGYVLVVNRELVMHRVFQAMTLKGPFPRYEVSTNKLIASDQWYVEEFNGTAAPVPEKGSYVVIQ